MAIWKNENNQLTKDYSFKDFKEAIDFVNKVSQLAEGINHHPDIFIHDYKKVRIFISTHSRKGITEQDYLLADKIDKI